MDKILHEIAGAVLSVLTALVPAALGAAVSLAYESGLTWGRRVVQMFVGICVSYFATNAARALWPWGEADPFLLQAISFVVGMIAFRATPRITQALVDRAADLPGSLLDRILPRKDRP